MAGERGVFGAAAHRAGRAVVQVAGEDGGLGLAPVGVERGQGGADFICGALRSIAGMAGLGLGGLTLGELFACSGQCGDGVGALFGLLQAEFERGDVGGDRLQGVDAGGELGAAGGERLLLRGGGGERLVGGVARGFAALGLRVGLGQARDRLTERLQTQELALRRLALGRARGFGL